MRVHVSGPSIGPVHTTLWSSGHRSRKPVPWKGWLIAYFTTAALWGISPLYGIPATVILAAITPLAVRARRAWRAAGAVLAPDDPAIDDLRSLAPTSDG